MDSLKNKGNVSNKYLNLFKNCIKQQNKKTKRKNFKLY